MISITDADDARNVVSSVSQLPVGERNEREVTGDISFDNLRREKVMGLCHECLDVSACKCPSP